MSEQQRVHPKKPNNIEELRRLKAAKKEAKKKLNNKPQVEQPPPAKVLERSFAAVPNPKVLSRVLGSLRIMTFNILAQSLIKRQLFPDSGDYIKWKPRRKMILDEIKLYNPDILTMQELDNFDIYYEGIFTELGYQVKYTSHPKKRHGCGIAYKKDKFVAVQEADVDYNTDSTCPPSYMTGNIAQMVALKLQSHPEVGFVVGNTHLYWRPTSNYERFRQTLIYSSRLQEFRQKLSSDTAWHLMLLGDFNTTPDDPVYGMLTATQLSQEQVEDLKASRAYSPSSDEGNGEEEEEEDEEAVSIDSLDSVESLLEKWRKLTWKSIYSYHNSACSDPELHGLFGEPKFTDYASQFKGTLDYMFIEETSPISIKQLLMLPQEEYVKPSLPNKNFGSDHLCLAADIEFC